MCSIASEGIGWGREGGLNGAAVGCRPCEVAGRSSFRPSPDPSTNSDARGERWALPGLLPALSRGRPRSIIIAAGEGASEAGADSGIGSGRASPAAILAQLGRVSADSGLLDDLRWKNELKVDSLLGDGLF